MTSGVEIGDRAVAAPTFRWAAITVVAVIASVVVLPINEVRSVWPDDGWEFSFAPVPLFSVFALVVSFFGFWLYATVFIGVLPVAAVVAFRMAAWKDRPGPIGPVYSTFIAAVATLAAWAALSLWETPRLAPPIFVVTAIGGHLVERGIRRRWSEQGPATVEDPVVS